MNLDAWDWLIAVTAALIVGVAKAGIGGLGLLAAVLFTQILPAKSASGALLPLLCLGDLVGAALVITGVLIQDRDTLPPTEA